MAKFKVETPTGIIEVEAADNATDAEIEALAREKYVPGQASTAAQAEPDAVPDTGMNQARIAGAVAGGVNAGIRPTVGAVMDMGRGIYNAATAAPISANPAAAVQAGMATPGSTVKIGDIQRVMSNPELRTVNAMQMARDPVLAAKEFAPRSTAMAQGLSRVVGRAVGPYGAITSAQDATQRFNNAQGAADYAQAGLSGLGALGYGAGTVFPPAKPIGMGIGLATDAINTGIDMMRRPSADQLREQMRRRAAARVTGPIAPGQQQ
jgi:hypothetical protein